MLPCYCSYYTLPLVGDLDLNNKDMGGMLPIEKGTMEQETPMISSTTDLVLHHITQTTTATATANRNTLPTINNHKEVRRPTIPIHLGHSWINGMDI